MVVKINSYYKTEIDKVKEISIKENYQLKNPFLFIFLNALGTLFNLTLLSKGLKFSVFLLYTIPLIIGLFYELYLMKQYKKSIKNQNIVGKILKLVVIKCINVFLFCVNFSLILVEAVVVNNFYFYEYGAYEYTLNKYYMICYTVVIIIFMIMFIIGNIIERKQIIKGKKKFFVPTAITSFLAIIGYFILKNSSYNFVIVVFIILFTIFPYAIGKIYFRYKNFNKQIGQNDILIDYKI